MRPAAKNCHTTTGKWLHMCKCLRLKHKCQCSFYLVCAALSSFALMMATIIIFVIETKRGTIQEMYIVSTMHTGLTLTFHMTSFILTVLVLAFHVDKILKKSYGFQSLEKNQLCILTCGLIALLLFIGAIVATIMNMTYVLVIGSYLVLDSVAFMLLCITYYKQREKMEKFVEFTLTMNRAEGLVLTEQHALDLCRLQAGEAEFKAMVQTGRYRQQLETIRIAEYYHLQKWCAELERLKQAEGPDLKLQRIDHLIKEMEERANVFGLNALEAIRWRELASFPKLLLPDDREGSEYTDSLRDEANSSRPFLSKSVYSDLTIHNGFCNHSLQP
ncbi:unnamed protein product [Bursaphelenchus xylophilus]|nr:unnamed protein product [Bursaphelenchus xylophilus]CAG9128811.1 unnamed protein product [Bursaphelenchus xylophilus]